jgi:hypothetical protein
MFRIQTGDPKPSAVASAADLADGIGRMYSMDTDDAILIWNLIPVRLSYRYDVSVIVDDLVPMLERMIKKTPEHYRVRWASDTFAAEWLIDTDGEQLVIESRWFNALGNYEGLLNSRSSVRVDRADFVREWLKIVTRVVADTRAKGVHLEDEDLLLRAETLLSDDAGPHARRE